MTKMDQDQVRTGEYHWKQVILKEILLMVLLKYLSCPHKSQVMGVYSFTMLSWNFGDIDLK